MVEVICPRCEECNYLINNHKPEFCGGNHSPNRIATQVDFDMSDHIRKEFHKNYFRKPTLS